MLSRREFLKRCRDISILITGSSLSTPQIADGFMQLLNTDKPNILFIQGQSCSGCTISATYGNETNFIDFIIRTVNLQVHPTLSFSQGEEYLQQMEMMLKEGNYILVIEGSIPTVIKSACMINHTPLANLLKSYIPKASLVIALGSCAGSGGIPASNRNETGAVSVKTYMEQHHIQNKLINILGCPAHPDRFMGTVAYHIATGKIPELTSDLTPEIYYGKLIHNRCSRFQYFSQDLYLDNFEKDKASCLLKKGCRGTITKSDCPSRRWNGGINVCIKSNTPCVGCMHPLWPFNEDIYISSNMLEDIPWSIFKEKTKGSVK